MENLKKNLFSIYYTLLNAVFIAKFGLLHLQRHCKMQSNYVLDS